MEMKTAFSRMQLIIVWWALASFTSFKQIDFNIVEIVDGLIYLSVLEFF